MPAGMAEIDPRHISKLSPELIDLIISAIVDSHSDNIAIQWTQDRHISASQLRRIERHFYDLWLPRLCLTLYICPWASTDFQFRPKKPTKTTSATEPLPEFVRFTRSKHPNPVGRDPPNSDVKAAWDRYDPQDPNLHIHFGDRLVGCPPESSPMVNDSELVGLCVSANGQEITFNWRKTFTAFFREELHVRSQKEEMIASGWPVVTNHAYYAFSQGKIRDLLRSGLI